MEICPASVKQTAVPRSTITIKNTISIGHQESCNCCCCSNPQPACLRYIQPQVPKSFKPTIRYETIKMPMELNSTYKLSYWGGPTPTASALVPVKPQDSLTVGEGPITDETIHKLSYLGNWCPNRDRAQGVAPWRTAKQWLGRGPMQDCTTHKNDFTWKFVTKSKPVKNPNNIYCPAASMTDDTTYKLSYYASNCRIPLKSFKPYWSQHYKKSDVPMDGCTTYKLSYWPNEMPLKEKYPWKHQLTYNPPSTPLDDDTTYRLSYWPNINPQRRKPFSAYKQTDNLLNAGCCFEDDTTYKLSYYGCAAEQAKRRPIKPIVRPTEFSNCPLAHDTIHKLSYLGNWSVPRVSAHINAPWRTGKQWLGRGPMQDVTTQKQDFTWKCSKPNRGYTKPDDNLGFSPLPLECCTTHKLSYYPNDLTRLVREKSFKPRIEPRAPLSVPMEKETTMRLSYQPVEISGIPKKPWAPQFEYHRPLVPMEQNTTYNLGYTPPGTLEPLSCDDECPSNPHVMSDICQQSVHHMARPCNTRDLTA